MDTPNIPPRIPVDFASFMSIHQNQNIVLPMCVVLLHPKPLPKVPIAFEQPRYHIVYAVVACHIEKFTSTYRPLRQLLRRYLVGTLEMTGFL